MKSPSGRVETVQSADGYSFRFRTFRLRVFRLQVNATGERTERMDMMPKKKTRQSVCVVGEGGEGERRAEIEGNV